MRPEAEALLRDVLARIKAKLKRPLIRIEGHTDAKGSDEYNDVLSQRRAASVKTWLVTAGHVPARAYHCRLGGALACSAQRKT